MIRLVLRLLAIFVWTVLALLIQSVMLVLPGRGKEWFARVYWRGIARVLGLRVRVTGTLSKHRPTLFIANHCSWMDVVALGCVLPGCFVAKAEIGQWPLVNWVARAGRTVFVSRNRTNVAREQAGLAARLEAGIISFCSPRARPPTATGFCRLPRRFSRWRMRRRGRMCRR